MNKILINGINNSSAGGKTVLLNFVKEFSRHENSFRVIILVSKLIENEVKKFISNTKIELIVVKKPNKLESLNWYLFEIPKIIKLKKIDLVLNFGDVPILTKSANQIFYFDWPHAIYPESVVWERFSRITWISKKIKLFIFKSLFKYIDHLIAQTNTAVNRLKLFYPKSQYTVLNNPVSRFSNKEEPVNISFEKSNYYLFFLTRYYEHKNLESIIPLAKTIKKNGDNTKILITIENNHGYGAKKLLNEITLNKLNDIIINLGEVSLGQVIFLYKRIDALFMPTLLESFSGTYIESMYFEKPILTSNIDFAREICGDGAIYFNPFKTKEQLDAIKTIKENKKKKIQLVKNQKKQLNNFINWETKTNKITQLINKILNE